MTATSRQAPQPTDEEVAAAVTALVAVLTGRALPAAPRHRPAWSDPGHGFRRGIAPAPGAWQSPATRLR